MKKASGGDSHLWQGAGKSFWTLPISRRWRRRFAVCFLEKLIGCLGFSRRGEYIGGRVMSGGGPGAHTRPRRGQGWPVPWGVWPPSGPPLSLLWTPSRIGKIGTLAFILSNSKNISCVTFLKHKNSRKQETDAVASR
jgi:hypothetical protein